MSRSKMVTALSITPIVLLALLAITFKVRAVMSENKTISRFAPVPKSPNAVSTEVEENHSHFIKPIPLTLSSDQVKRTLKEELSKLPRVTLITEDGNYLHYEFKSLIFHCCPV